MHHAILQYSLAITSCSLANLNRGFLLQNLLSISLLLWSAFRSLRYNLVLYLGLDYQVGYIHVSLPMTS